MNVFTTHDVSNQVTELTHYNLYTSDVALINAVESQGGAFASDKLIRYGAIAGSELLALGFEANQNKPVLKTHDRFGHRLDEVVFHPSYHRIMAIGVEHGISHFAWQPTQGSHVARAALSYLHNQVESGTSCPLTMTHSAIPSLRLAPKLAEKFLPLITSPHYQSTLADPLTKTGLTIGMGMTEKQGGSDVRANTTRATRIGQDELGEVFAIVGHKWFFSAPMCDAFLVLAQTEGGLSCFFMPRIWPGEKAKNGIHIQRLKDKLGNWSNASSEVEFVNARAWLIGAEGRGIASILEMVALTRLDCMIGSASIMRQALVQAIHHTRQRSAFGKLLSEQVLMQNVLADLALESEAATLLTMRVAKAVDHSFAPTRDTEVHAHESALSRLLTAIGKYWICKRCTAFVNEAQECLGGAGYVEEHMMPRLLREAPLNSIWEGSGNIQCLDVLRAISREPQTMEAFWQELSLTAKDKNSRVWPLLERMKTHINALLANAAQLELHARSLVESMALLIQAHLMVRHAPEAVATAYCESRLNPHAASYGTLTAQDPIKEILARAFIN